jgi:nucleolar complex protein 3
LTSNQTEIALQCLSTAFLKRREYSVIRLASFAKQLATLALHSTASTSAPILAFLRQLFHRYQSLEQLLENEQDVITEGQYDPNVEDPEHANPFATSLWELSLLNLSYQLRRQFASIQGCFPNSHSASC